MAQTMDQDRAAKNATPSATGTPAPKGITREAFQARLRSFFSPPPPRATATGTQVRPKGGMMKMAFGMVVFLLAAEFIGPALAVVNNKLSLGLEKIVVLPQGVPLLGGMTALLLLYFLAILGLWIVLLKLNIIPRDPFGVKAAQRARTQAATATTATRRPGGPRTRAERRHDATTAAAKATTSKATTSKSTSGTRRAPVTNSDRVATAEAGTSNTSVRVGQPGAHDDAYERARAAAQRRRRASRR